MEHDAQENTWPEVFVQRTRNNGPKWEVSYQGDFNGMKQSFIKCSTPQDCLRLRRALKGLPRKHFLEPYFSVRHKGEYYLGVEKFDNFLYPYLIDPNIVSEIQLKKPRMARYMIDMAIDLDRAALIHANLSLKKMVVSNGQLKSYDVPAEAELGSVKFQAEQIYNIMKDIVECGCQPTDDIVDVLEMLKGAYSTLDLKNCQIHPVFMNSTERRGYHESSWGLIVAQEDVKEIKKRFNRIVGGSDSVWNERRRKVDRAWKNVWSIPWQHVITTRGSDGMNHVLNWEIKGKIKKDADNVPYYSNAPYQQHRFIRNATQHFNSQPGVDETTTQVTHKKKNITEVQRELESLFPRYLMDMHMFMCKTGYIDRLHEPKRDEIILIKLWCTNSAKIKFRDWCHFDGFLQTIKIADFICAKLGAHFLNSEFGLVRREISEHAERVREQYEFFRVRRTFEDVMDVTSPCSVAVKSLRSYIIGLVAFLYHIVTGKTARESLAQAFPYFCCWDEREAGRLQDVMDKVVNVPGTVEHIFEFMCLPEAERESVAKELGYVFVKLTDSQSENPLPRENAWARRLRM